MQYTAFDTPYVTPFLHRFALFLLKVCRWRVSGVLPSEKKYVMIAAPHTSNWDLPVMLTIVFALHARVAWMGKKAIFRWPFGGFFRWLGGIPIDRSKSHDTVSQTIEIFEKRDNFVLIVAPEGTRKHVSYWKSGFYHIAVGAGVPISLGFLDFRRKVGGIGPTVHPTGDLEMDLAQIRSFYSDISGKHVTDIGDISVLSNPESSKRSRPAA